MIHSIYIIYQKTGGCLIYRKYGQIEYNEQIVSGLLISLEQFLDRVTDGKGHITKLPQFYNTKFCESSS